MWRAKDPPLAHLGGDGSEAGSPRADCSGGIRVICWTDTKQRQEQQYRHYTLLSFSDFSYVDNLQGRVGEHFTFCCQLRSLVSFIKLLKYAFFSVR